MHEIPVPERPVQFTASPRIVPASLPPEKDDDAFDRLLKDLPLLKAVYDSEKEQLRQIMKDLGPAFSDSPIYQDRVVGDVLEKGPLHYQGFLSVLNAIHKDPKNYFRPVLLRFMEEHKIDVIEVIAKALLEKEIHESLGGQPLKRAIESFSQWKPQIKEESGMELIARGLESAIDARAIGTRSDLIKWVRENCLERYPYIRYPDLAPSQLLTFLEVLGLDREKAPPFTRLDQAFDRLLAMLDDSSVPPEATHFIATVLLPEIHLFLEKGGEEEAPRLEQRLESFLKEVGLEAFQPSSQQAGANLEPSAPPLKEVVHSTATAQPKTKTESPCLQPERQPVMSKVQPLWPEAQPVQREPLSLSSEREVKMSQTLPQERVFSQSESLQSALSSTFISPEESGKTAGQEMQLSEFPVIIPYPTTGALSRYGLGRRRRKRKEKEMFEQHWQEEEEEKSEQPPLARTLS